MTAGAVVIAAASGCGGDRSERTAATGIGSTSERPSVQLGRRAQPAPLLRGGPPVRSSRREAEHERGRTTTVIDVRSGAARRTDTSSAAEVIEVARKALRGGRSGGARKPDREGPAAVLEEQVRDALRGEVGPGESEAASDRALDRAAALLRRALAEG